MKHRENSFDLVRHFAALLVFYSHHYALSNRSEPVLLHWDTYGFIAVVIFFTISGYFMPASFNSSKNFIEFMGKRCRRIFPGLIACSFIITYIIGGIFIETSRWDYITSSWTLKTFIMGFSFIGRTAPGIFSHFKYPNAVDGSLWTLPIEFACYLIFSTALTFSNNFKAILALFLISAISTSVLFATGLNYSFYAVPMNYLSIFGLAFTAGALLSMTQHHWFSMRWRIVLISAVLLEIFSGRPEIEVIGTICISVITVVIGTSFKDKFIKGKFDISYGIYIYAFPIQQLVINLVAHHFWLSMLISLPLTLLAGYLSYRFVEKPFLRKKFLREEASEISDGQASTLVAVTPI